MTRLPLTEAEKEAKRLHRLEYHRAYRANNIERMREMARVRMAKWRAEHPERAQASGRASMNKWRLANPEEAQAVAKRKREKHPERIKAQKKASVERNRETHNARNRRWAEANPDKINAKVRRRRASKRNAEGSHTAEDIQTQFDAQGAACFYCGATMVRRGKGRFHADHFIPLSRGGSDWPSNIVCACPTCNDVKFNKMPWEWMPDRFQPPEIQ